VKRGAEKPISPGSGVKLLSQSTSPIAVSQRPVVKKRKRQLLVSAMARCGWMAHVMFL